MYQQTDAEKNHRLEAEARLSSEGRKYFKFIEFDEDEQLVTEIKKHPFGLIIILATGALLILALFAITVFSTFVDFGNMIGIAEANNVAPLLAVLSFVLIIGVVVMTYIGAFLYSSNVIYVTS